MSDPFKTHAVGMTDPIVRAEDVLPSDTTDIAVTSRAIYVGGAGDLRVTLSEGDTVTLSAAGAGWHPIRVNRIWATGTTATSIVSCS